MECVERLTGSAEETFEVARQLGESLSGGEVFALVGDLGSGKTTFTRGLVCGAGCATMNEMRDSLGGLISL